ncbi:hypothetical protein [Azorhizobium doebereinerae]|uniref:hypothetical protein n=1 Tax=Azorhizobium doebereinerae TaxID=281091 RepID=UPI0009FD8FAA|nr:hypothetical protein [Azorhizobium doebereinerae]
MPVPNFFWAFPILFAGSSSEFGFSRELFAQEARSASFFSSFADVAFRRALGMVAPAAGQRVLPEAVDGRRRSAAAARR